MKCLNCDYESTNDFKICPKCKTTQGELKKKRDTSEDTIVLLKKQIDDIQNLLVEEEKKSKPIRKRKKMSSKEKQEVLQKVEEIIELPKEKKTKETKKDIKKEVKDIEVDLGKTIAITKVKDDEGLDLVEEINKQIEEVNEEAKVEKKQVEETEKIDTDKENLLVGETSDEVETVEKDNDIKNRRNILLATGAVVLVFIIIVFSVFMFSNTKTQQIQIDYAYKMNTALETYYETENIDDIIYILEEVKNDSEKVSEVQAKTKIVCESWVLLYLNEEVDNKENFEEATTKYKGLIEGLYRYAIVKTDTNLVRALTEKDYDELLKQIDNIYSDSSIFYDALELYNQKDYNKAYYMFSRIEESNSYYDKSITYNNKIIDNIMNLIENDISKLEQNIDELDDSEKLKVYTSIEQIIIDYNNVYSNVELSDNNSYQELLSKYTSKVAEYTDIVVGTVM